MRISVARSRPIVCLVLIAGKLTDYLSEVTCVTQLLAHSSLTTERHMRTRDGKDDT